MQDNGVTCSMSRSGNCWDNAAMESFFSSQDRTGPQEGLSVTRSARADVFDYIERFYNHRRHSTLGYLSPIDFGARLG
jgi:putative transposase